MAVYFKALSAGLTGIGLVAYGAFVLYFIGGLPL